MRGWTPLGHTRFPLAIYAHLFEDNHADAMNALGAMATPKAMTDNVVPLRR
jgi:hypothetical protein